MAARLTAVRGTAVRATAVCRMAPRTAGRTARYLTAITGRDASTGCRTAAGFQAARTAFTPSRQVRRARLGAGTTALPRHRRPRTLSTATGDGRRRLPVRRPRVLRLQGNPAPSVAPGGPQGYGNTPRPTGFPGASGFSPSREYLAPQIRALTLQTAASAQHRTQPQEARDRKEDPVRVRPPELMEDPVPMDTGPHGVPGAQGTAGPYAAPGSHAASRPQGPPGSHPAAGPPGSHPAAGPRGRTRPRGPREPQEHREAQDRREPTDPGRSEDRDHTEPQERVAPQDRMVAQGPTQPRGHRAPQDHT